MGVEIEIKVDPTGAVGAAKQVGDAFGKAEDAGKKAGDGIDEALQKAISRGQAAKDAIESLRKELQVIDAGGTSGNRANALERELDLYTKIKGPLRDYSADLRALDSHLEKVMITTNEYADAVTRLNTQLAKRPGETPQAVTRPTGAGPASSGGSGAGDDLMGMLASRTGISSAGFQNLTSAQNLAVGAAIALGTETIKLGDDYIELSNRVQRYADSEHSAGGIIRDQLGLADDLHAKLDKTVDIYSRLREGSDGLHLTYRQTIDLTKSLGEGVELSGKSLDQAGQLAQRMAYWMDTGTVSQRELKNAMREFPAVAEVWEKALGKDKDQLLELAKQGKLTGEDLTLALTNAGAALDEQFGKRVETVGEAWDHLKDQVTVSVGEMVSQSGAIQSITEDIKVLGDQLKNAAGFAGGLAEAIDKLTGGKGVMSKVALGGLGNFKDAQQMFPWLAGVGGVESQGTAGDAFKGVVEKFQGEEMKELAGWALRTADGFERDAMEGAKFVDTLGNILEKIHNHKTGISEVEKIYQEATQGAVNWQKQMNALNALFDMGRLTAKQYAEELTRINARSPDHNFETQLKKDIVAYDEAAKAARLYREAAQFGLSSNQYSGDAQGSRDLSTDVGAYKSANDYGDKMAEAQEKLRASILGTYETSGGKFADELAKLTAAEADGTITTDDYTKFVQRLHDQYAIGLTPIQEWQKEQRTAKDLLDNGAISIDQYSHKLDELSAKYDTSSGQGVTNAAKKINDDIKNMSATTAAAIENTWSSFNDNLAKQIATGKADWNSFLTQMKTDAVKLGLQGIEKQLLGGSGGSLAGAQATGTATGTSAATTMLAAAPEIGAAIGQAAAAVMAIGSSAGSFAAFGGGAANAAAASQATDAVATAVALMARNPTGGGGPTGGGRIGTTDLESAVLAVMASAKGEQVHLVTVAKNAKKIRSHVMKR